MKKTTIAGSLKTITTFVLIAAMMMLLPQFVMAQIGGNGTEGTTVSPDAPIDGGLSLLVAAGVGYGIKKTRDARKKRNETKSDYAKQAERLN